MRRTNNVLVMIVIGLLLVACDGDQTPTAQATPTPSLTPKPTDTSTPTATDTPTSTPTATPTATATPPVTPTTTGWPTPTQIVSPPPEWWTPEATPLGGGASEEYVRCMASSGYRCNLRACPGMECEVVWQVWSGQTLPLDAGYQGGDWWRVETPDGEVVYGHKDWFVRVQEG